MKRTILTTVFTAMATLTFADDFNSWPVPCGPIQEMTYTENATRFCLWSPKAESVRVNLYAEGSKQKAAACTEQVLMARQSDGTWTATVVGDLHKKFYTFQIKTTRGWQEETTGIFAKAVGINGERAQILDMRTTDPQGWGEDRAPKMSSASDVILYEMHHRDFSVGPESGIKNKGKFLALTEMGTKNAASHATGIDHLRELGVTHVHLLPSYDFGSIDERTGNALGGGGRVPSSYNWGYDPVNYNVPEGSYATDASDPSVRIREFKEMVMAMHKAGIRVVLDVVYNHVFDLGKSNFQRTAPDYFFRWKDRMTGAAVTAVPVDGALNSKTIVAANGSGCGNETASDRLMMRKYMVESVLYWMKEYHIDGFRFDLMGIHDIETMNSIRQAAQSIDPNVFIYGEGWAAETPVYPADKLAMKANTAQLGGIAAFGDEMRDGLRGGWQDDKEGAFLIGKSGNEESVKFGIVGAIQHPGIDFSTVNYTKVPWAAEPTEMISYVSCHDDMCLADRIKCTLEAKKGAKKGEVSIAERVRLQKLAETVVLTSQGVPFIWCGDEIMRDKKGVHNSFSSPDDINQISWTNKTTHKDVFDYVSAIIAIRKAHPAFRMGSAEAVRNNLKFLPIPKGMHNVIAYRLDGKAVGDQWGEIIVVLNSNEKPVTMPVTKGKYTVVVNDGKADSNGVGGVNGNKVLVPAQSALIMWR